jgi:superfamily I DNA/RNA helicase
MTPPIEESIIDMAAAQSRSKEELSPKEAVLKDLNGEQRQAAEATDRPTLVVSPAGTGKTRVLAARYQLMLAEGVPTSRMLAITFSNRATQEMRDRIGPVLDGVDERDLFINTFHALGKRILRSMPGQFGLTDQFRIADEGETHQILREAVLRVDRELLEGPFGQDKIKRLAELLDQMKNQGMTPDAVASAGRRFQNRNIDPMDLEILEEYEAQMQSDNIVDYNDLILKPLLAFDRDPKLAANWRRQFDAIMIDEYQDTNRMQYRLLRHLTQDKKNVLFLGDDDQLIFAWRGADNSYVIDFENQWTNGQVLSLRINYRNGPAIVEQAKSLISRNENRRVKDMVAHRSNKAVMEMRTFDDQSQEQDYIARLIKSHIEKGTELDQIAVLTRNRTEATTIALSLAGHDIPCYYPDNDILSQREVRALISWARIAVDETDRLALMNAMATPDIKLTAAAIDKLNDWAREREVPLIEVVRDSVASGRAAKGGPLERFLTTFDAVRALDVTHARAFEDISSTVGLDVFAQAQSPAAVQGLNQALAIFSSTFEEVQDINAVLDAIAISFRSTIEAKQGQARVRVDTMHASKGLEFDLVIVSGWEEGHFPRTSKSSAELEESRRLAYVTLSRARNTFVATVVRRRPNGSRPPSRFLSEIGMNADMVSM